MTRTLLAGVGAASTASGLLLLATPLSVPLEAPVLPVLGAAAVLAIVVGGLGGLGRSAVRPEDGAFEQSNTSRPGRTPGDGFDERLANLSVRGDGAERDRIEARLVEAAVDVLVEAEGCSRSAARRRVTAGEWPEDATARAFFAGDPPSVRERARTVLRGDPTFARRARRTADVLAERRGDR
ncbi:MAG: hypothetical protein ABEH83_03005 [Halobacterium sp.]